MKNTPINEIVSLIEDFAPNELALLRKRFPESVNLLESGKTLGTSDENALFVKITTCLAGLRLIIEKCKELMPRIKKRIFRVSNLQLASQIIVAVSGATIISTLQNDGLSLLKYVSSSLVLLGSILGIYAQHKSNSIYNNSSFFSVYASLNEYFLQAEQHLNDLEILSNIHPLDEHSREEIAQIIQNANATCVQIRKIISQNS